MTAAAIFSTNGNVACARRGGRRTTVVVPSRRAGKASVSPRAVTRAPDGISQSSATSADGSFTMA